jgi:hypothetical protein
MTLSPAPGVSPDALSGDTRPALAGSGSGRGGAEPPHRGESPQKPHVRSQGPLREPAQDACRGPLRRSRLRARDRAERPSVDDVGLRPRRNGSVPGRRGLTQSWGLREGAEASPTSSATSSVEDHAGGPGGLPHFSHAAVSKMSPPRATLCLSCRALRCVDVEPNVPVWRVSVLTAAQEEAE